MLPSFDLPVAPSGPAGIAPARQGFAVAHVFGPPQAVLRAEGIQVEVSSFAPTDGVLDHHLDHHLLLAWLSPEPIRMRACFDDRPAGSVRRMTGFANLGFIPAQVRTRCRYDAGATPHRSVAVRLAPQLFNRLDDEAAGVATAALASCNFRDPDIQSGMRLLAREALAPGFASALLAESIGTALLVQLARRGGRAGGERPRGGLAPWQMRRIVDRLTAIEQEAGVPTLAELAALAGISAAHLRRAFRQSTGRTLGEHVRQVRFERACALLAQTHRPLADIAAQLGFTSPYGFTVAFRRCAGQTPSAYRQRERALRTGAGRPD